jgi:hypothetical protein
VIALRVVAIVLALFMLFVAGRRYARQRSRRLDFLVWLAISAGIIVVGVYPQVAAPVLDTFNFDRGDNRQLIGLLVISNFILFLLYLRLSGQTAIANRDISRLVRALAQGDFRKEVPRKNTADIIVVIPAYDEEASVGHVLAGLPDEVCGRCVEALVVVDGARDRTEDVVRRHGTPAVHAINRGQGAALRTGYELAVERGAEVIVITDADGQTQPEEMSRLVQPIVSGEADFVNGSRWLGDYNADGRVRAVGVAAFSLIVSVLTWRRVTDVASPFRAFRASAVPTLRLYEDQFQASELLIEAIRRGLRYREVPITMNRRNSGESKKPNLPRYGLGVAKSIFNAWLR